MWLVYEWVFFHFAKYFNLGGIRGLQPDVLTQNNGKLYPRVVGCFTRFSDFQPYRSLEAGDNQW